MSGGEDTRHPLRSRRAREALRGELSRENTAGEHLLAWSILLGPIVLALVLPAASWIAGGIRDEVLEISLVTCAAILLLFGGYAGLLNLAVGGWGDRERAVLLRRSAVLDPRDPPADGTCVYAEGRLEGSTVRAPLTGREVLFCETSVTVVSPRSRGSAHQSFSDHATDTALHAAGVTLRLEVEGARLRGGRVIGDTDAYPDGVEACLARAGLSRSEGDEVLVRERAVRRGDLVTVFGVLRRADGYREGDGLRLVGDEEGELVLHLGEREELIRTLTPRRSPWVIPGLLSFALGLACCATLAFWRWW